MLHGTYFQSACWPHNQWNRLQFHSCTFFSHTLPKFAQTWERSLTLHLVQWHNSKFLPWGYLAHQVRWGNSGSQNISKCRNFHQALHETVACCENENLQKKQNKEKQRILEGIIVLQDGFYRFQTGSWVLENCRLTPLWNDWAPLTQFRINFLRSSAPQSKKVTET